MQSTENRDVNDNTSKHATMKKQHSKENRDWASTECKTEHGVLHVQQRTETTHEPASSISLMVTPIGTWW